MRIPSQFNEDNLYQRHNRRDESAQTFRRLIRLMVGLALVVVVMRQAARPEIYQPFFRPHPSSVVAAVPTTTTGTANSANRVAVEQSEPIPAEDRDLANRLVEELRPSDQRQWVVALSRWQAGKPIEAVPSTLESLVDSLASSTETSETQRLSWQVMLDSFVSAAAEPDQSKPPTTIDSPIVRALLRALDDAAEARVFDGTVWRSGDFDAFYRYLDQAENLSAQGVASTGVLPLLQQHDVFRGQLILSHGTVARSERISARENPYGIADYWQLWLRPLDGADRPLVAIVPSVPSAVEAVGPNAVAEQGPHVTIVGRFLKRLAYESGVGADLAPVVIGRIATAPLAQTELAPNNKVEDASGRMWLIVTTACLIGFSLAVIAMWRTSAMAKRARELRTANRKAPDEFLRKLKNNPSGNVAVRSTEARME